MKFRASAVGTFSLLHIMLVVTGAAFLGKFTLVSWLEPLEGSAKPWAVPVS